MQLQSRVDKCLFIYMELYPIAEAERIQVNLGGGNQGPNISVRLR